MFTSVESCILDGVALDAPDENDIRKRTGIQLAAGHGHHMIVRLLLDNGAQASVEDCKGNTALHYASQNTPAVISQEQEAADKAKAGEAGNTWKVWIPEST